MISLLILSQMQVGCNPFPFVQEEEPVQDPHPLERFLNDEHPDAKQATLEKE